MKYILLTIVRDEAENLTQVIKSVQKQTQLPELWLIVDDGSRDKTFEILADVELDWLVTKRYNERQTKSLMHFGQLMAENAKELTTVAKQRKISWEGLGVLDGDSEPEADYFTNLMSALEEDGKIGITSGELTELGTLKPISHNSNIPWGAATIYRRKCFEEIDGLAPTPCHESVEIALAQSKGYKTTILKGTYFTHRRPMGSKDGWYRGHVDMGSSARWLGLPISFALAKSIRLTLSRHPLRGFGYLIGFLTWRGKKCDIPEIKDAYGKRWGKWWNSKKI